MTYAPPCPSPLGPPPGTVSADWVGGAVHPPANAGPVVFEGQGLGLLSHQPLSADFSGPSPRVAEPDSTPSPGVRASLDLSRSGLLSGATRWEGGAARGTGKGLGMGPLQHGSSGSKEHHLGVARAHGSGTDRLPPRVQNKEDSSTCTAVLRVLQMHRRLCSCGPVCVLDCFPHCRRGGGCVVSLGSSRQGPGTRHPRSRAHTPSAHGLLLAYGRRRLPKRIPVSRSAGKKHATRRPRQAAAFPWLFLQ